MTRDELAKDIIGFAAFFGMVGTIVILMVLGVIHPEWFDSGKAAPPPAATQPSRP